MYKVITTGPYLLERMLNEAAEDGWRVVGSPVVVSGPAGLVTVILAQGNTRVA